MDVGLPDFWKCSWTSRPCSPRHEPIGRCGQAEVRGLLESLAGSLVALFTFRRRLLSLLNLIYTEPRNYQRNQVFAMSSGLQEELWTCALLILFAVTNLRASLVATDASNSWRTMVHTHLGADFSLEVGRHGLSKQRWSRLLLPFAACKRAAGLLPVDEEMPDGVGVPPHPLWMEIFPGFAVRGRQTAPHSLRGSNQCVRAPCCSVGSTPASRPRSADYRQPQTAKLPWGHC